MLCLKNIAIIQISSVKSLLPLILIINVGINLLSNNHVGNTWEYAATTEESPYNSPPVKHSFFAPGHFYTFIALQIPVCLAVLARGWI